MPTSSIVVIGIAFVGMSLYQLLTRKSWPRRAHDVSERLKWTWFAGLSDRVWMNVLHVFTLFYAILGVVLISVGIARGSR